MAKDVADGKDGAIRPISKFQTCWLLSGRAEHLRMTFTYDGTRR